MREPIVRRHHLPPQSYNKDHKRRQNFIESRQRRREENYIEGENWVPIPGYSKYEVSNLGRIKNAVHEKLLKQHLNSYGYYTVGLTSDRGVHATKLVHRLVAYIFCHGDETLHVNHIDGNKTNNYATNLEWVTPKQNTAHAINTGLWDPSKQKSSRGVRIVETGQEFRTQVECGVYLNVPQSAIQYALKHKGRTAGYHVEHIN